VLTRRGYVPVSELTQGDRVATGEGISELVYDVVCGSLLGDGSIGARSGCFAFSHSERQYDYAVFKAQLLGELSPAVDASVVAAAAGGGRACGVVRVRTRAHRALRPLRTDFHRRRKLVPEWLADELNPRMLAFWFMDDGCCRMRGGGRRPRAEIATEGFSDGDRQVLLRGLLRLGLPAKASRGRLYFDVAGTHALCEMIAPYVPPAMRHKLHPEVAARVPFDLERVQAGPSRVMYDEVEVEALDAPPDADRTYFCIDVDETNNFVTAGGVVHNCRPPGNRDPLPGEIDACQDYLFRQLELIEPRVVCTLGNFATKLLRADPATGITRLHGREEIRRIGPRAVRLYPLYHPAAALYTPSMLDILRTDFRRIPELLALPAPEQPAPEAAEPAVAEPEVVADVREGEPEAGAEPVAEEHPAQLGLF
jgi:uracil-DNA glycosylase family 4